MTGQQAVSSDKLRPALSVHKVIVGVFKHGLFFLFLSISTQFWCLAGIAGVGSGYLVGPAAG